MVNITFGSPKKDNPNKNKDNNTSSSDFSSLFGSKKPVLAKQNNGEVLGEIRDLSRRVRVLEERLGNIRTKQTVTEQNMLSRNKQLTTEIRTTNSDFIEIKKDMNELKDRILLLIKEIKSLAKNDDVQVLQRYINMWDPVRFVTHNEIEDIVKEIIERQQKDL